MRALPRGRREWGRAMLLLFGLAALVAGGVWWMTGMPGRSHSGPLPPLGGGEVETERRLRRHVEALAGEIGERHLERPKGLDAAARYIEGALAELGYSPARQDLPLARASAANVEAERRGEGRADELLILGAHYDSVWGSPGANDNATGVAAALEIARLLRDARPARTLRFVFFANEEPPYFQTEAMGSLHYARRCRTRGERVRGMFSLETLGCYSDAPDSQLYPFPFGLLYPSTGNFAAFVANLPSRGLVRRALGSFRRHAAFPSEGVAAPGWIMGIGWSDHWSFWEQGYPAVMVTDTALFRYGAYHTAEDTPEKVQYDRLARVVHGLARMAEELAAEER